MIGSIPLSPELSAMVPESGTCQKTLPMLQELFFFLELCKSGDRGDRSAISISIGEA